MKKIPEKVYDPKKVEKKLYKQWMDAGYFTAHKNPDKKPFTIVIPPPNVTGQLHMGHALDDVLQDILIRTKRMQGFEALWVPGTDHASIATEVKIVENLAKEGITKEMLGRKGFLEKAWEWKEQYGGRIVEQIKQMGCSCDWSRERFTMDEGCSHAVNEVFVRLYEKGLIYRGNRIINWCPDCRTALSDAEVEYEDQASHLWYLRYYTPDKSEYVVVATTRPETMMGDTAVAVHPEDERYRHLVGKTLILPIMNREIPVSADDYVDREFGTGVVKITPAHDPNDFEMGQRHNLQSISVMDEGGVINEQGGMFCGMKAIDARQAVVDKLEELGCLEKIEDYSHSVGTCYRCGATVEPMISDQWFVRMKPLAEPAIEAVRSGRVKFVPERFEKIYFNWMENVRDWCISRQLWWGHRIPAWYCEECGELMVARSAPEKCSKCGSAKLRQDEDVLDTWFSSGMWPFSTLGWPDKTDDLEYFYPTDVLVTGYEIIFFWVARMIVFGLEVMGEIPFHTVMIHGIVRDSQGRKMSKSLGNGIDPLDVVEQYGTDALRFSLVQNNSIENDMRFYYERVESARNFANKIWNAARFILMNAEGMEISGEIDMAQLENEDKWILSKLDEAIGQITQNIERYELGMAAQKVYDFLWSDYCDWYIEMAKPRLNGTEEEKKRALSVLLYVLRDILKMLHPFMPFVTDEIYQSLPGTDGSIMVSSWPEQKNYGFEKEQAGTEEMMEIIRAIRNLRRELNIPPSKKAALYLYPAEGKDLRYAGKYFERLAMATEILRIGDKSEAPRGCASAVCSFGQIYLPIGELIDIDKEKQRLNKEAKRLEQEIARAQGKLKNQGFLAKAPEKVVEEEKRKLSEYEAMQKKVADLLEAMEG